MSIINRTMYPVQTSMGLISKMQDRFASLQVQLATGEKATTLAEMGTDRFLDISIRNRLGRMEGYSGNIDMVTMRLGLMDQVMSRLDALESETRNGMTVGTRGTNNINFSTVPTLAKSRLDEVLTLLNTDADGRYLFAGREADRKPVPTLAAVLDGAGGKAGFKQVAAERQAADVGSGMGRVGASSAGATVTIAEDGDHRFGFKLTSATASNMASIAPNRTPGPPASLTLAVAVQPTSGNTVSIGLTLPDGSNATVKLTATAVTPAGPGEFSIGSDEAATAANLEGAIEAALTALAGTELVAASNFAAATNFFNENGDPVLRVTGPDFANATALDPADLTTTLQWYSGSSSTDPRSSVSSKIDDAAVVSYGAQANESGPVSLIRALAVQAIQGFSNDDPTSGARYDAVAERSQVLLSEARNNERGSIEMMTVEIGTASATTAQVADRQKTYQAQLKNLLGDISSVSKEEVAMEMLALQTRLQASYQATSLVAQLSLVNYLGR